MYDFGYDISDFYEIQDEYGTMEDFENLLAKAKELGKLEICSFFAIKSIFIISSHTFKLF